MRDGLAYACFLPSGPPQGRVVIVHGADSQKENHYPFARACRGAGLAAVAFDLRGHGASEGALDDHVLEDIAAIAAIATGPAPLALRGSSLGGYLALLAGPRLGAQAVAAICPAAPSDLARALRGEHFDFRADLPALTRFLSDHDDLAAAREFEGGLLVLHAEGDQQVPIEHSRQLVDEAGAARSRRLIAMPGGHHRSIQRDEELAGVVVRWLARALSGPQARAAGR